MDSQYNDAFSKCGLPEDGWQNEKNAWGEAKASLFYLSLLDNLFKEIRNDAIRDIAHTSTLQHSEDRTSAFDWAYLPLSLLTVRIRPIVLLEQPQRTDHDSS